MWTQHEKSFRKIVNISHNRRFCGFIFKFVWAVYGGDLTGFCQSFRKVIFKNDQRQTKSKKSQNVHGYEPLWYAHSTALPQSYPASIGSGARPPIFKALIGAGNMPSAELGRSRNVLIHLYLVNTRTTYKNFDIFYKGFYNDPLSDLRPDLEVSGCRDFDYVTSFTKFQILAEI